MNRSGQVLLIGVLMLLVLFIAIPAIILVNKTSSQHSMASQQKTKGRSIIDEGIVYVIGRMSRLPPMDPPIQAGGGAGAGPQGDGDASHFVVQSVIPKVMFPNQMVPISVTFRNMGTVASTAWTDAAYRLGSVQNTTWDCPNPQPLLRQPQGVLLAAGETFVPGGDKAFTFLVKAPPAAGTYQMQWTMVHEGQHPFGANSDNVTVLVQDLPAGPANWPYLGGTLPTNQTYLTAQGNHYSAVYTASPNPGLLSYQVGILSRPLDSLNNVIPGSSVFAVVSQKTVGVKMPTGLSAAAAVQLSVEPPAGTNLIVSWGPLIYYNPDPNDLNPFDISAWMDANQTPRKFSTGPIRGATFPRAPDATVDPSDKKEYWAYADLGLPAPIDVAYYQRQAQTVTNVGFTDNAWPADWSCTPANTCWHLGNTGYFYVPPGSLLTIGDTGDGWNPGWANSTTNTNVLYIDGGLNGLGGGNVELRDVAIELKDRGALIVTGNMTIGRRRDDSGLRIASAPIPITAGLEHPYPGTWGCSGYIGQMCPDMAAFWNTGARRLSIRGFVYVVGNLRIENHNPGTGVWTEIAGTLRVDGQLSTAAGATFGVFMDDTINHAIRTTNFELQIDSLAPAP